MYLWVSTKLFYYNIWYLSNSSNQHADKPYKKSVTNCTEVWYKYKIWPACTFCGVLLENEILTLPQVFRTLCSDPTNCLARSAPYLQFSDKSVKACQIMCKLTQLHQRKKGQREWVECITSGPSNVDDEQRFRKRVKFIMPRRGSYT
jgi:hypothetical protein